MNKIQLTQDGYDNLKNELQTLQEVRRPQTVEKLQKARSMGDLRENNAYHAAKDELGELDGRILEVQHILKHAVITASNGVHEVQLGHMVTVEVNGIQSTFSIVGEFESDPMNGKLSSTSPIGAALLGAKVGMSVTIPLPSGAKTYKVIEIR